MNKILVSDSPPLVVHLLTDKHQCLVLLMTVVSMASAQLYYGSPYATHAHLHSAPLLASPYHAAIHAPIAYPSAPLSNAWSSHYAHAPIYATAPLVHRHYYK